MLININPTLSPDLLFHLRSMGHGEQLILADANFPSNKYNKNTIRLDGVNIPKAAEAILSVFPLDSFSVKNGNFSVYRMEVDNKPKKLTQTHKEFIKIVKKVSGKNWKVGSIEREEFYSIAKKAYCIVSTSDARPFGCFILTKGVILPNGKVWK